MGQLVRFVGYQSNEEQEVWCYINIYDRIDDFIFSEPDNETCIVVHSSDVVSALIWCTYEGHVKVLPPRQCAVGPV